MPRTKVLITGGAGFIGSHLADHMISRGYEIRVLDSLEPQVHPGRRKPDYLNPGVTLWTGPVRDRGLLNKALDGVEIVVHLASVVGVGDVTLDLTRAVITPGETRLRVRCFVADVRLSVPEDVGVAVTSTAFVSEARFFERKRESILTTMRLISDNYELAERRVCLENTAFVGEIRVRRA